MKKNAFYGTGLGLIAAGAVALLNASAFADEPTKGIAVLHPTKGSNVEGTVIFTKSGDEMKIVADVTGLTPGQTRIPYSRMWRLLVARWHIVRRPF